ncbi:DUF262 and DUF1524 domain-containing protein [Virgibacillus sp. MSJ-26]|uniref:DUF262 and DUF1524 domain-containing protein n=1 Tax=Virgibacillus sp. MSJ-26 TaxID=2841522 RepID=UPI00209CF30A|nr:DUF262 and DUF1524 domain-containing protein [Virgibacillus sp. MSJ-26]
MQGTKQFIIPIYQRKYSWTKKQCAQLWEDIVKVSNDDDTNAHFVGSIVYIEKGVFQVSTVPQLLVIDGQQRLTTMSLLLLALSKELKERKQKYSINSRKVMNYYLVNNEEDDDLYHKLILNQIDNETLNSLIEDRELPEEYSPRIYENFNYFVDQIRKNSIDIDQLFSGLKKLIIVDVALDRDHDNPQLIFESLNSTGLELSQADLIRNYVLMSLTAEEQKRLYKKYWRPMEKSFDNLNESILFDRFMRDYLTVKTGRIPNIKNVYTDFKKYLLERRHTDIEDILEDVYKYSKYFVRLAFQTEKDDEIKDVLKDFNSLKVDVSYPFLLEVYDDYSNDILSKSQFITILKIVESYVFRRAICGVPTNSLNKTFATISKEIDKGNYLESVKIAFLLKDSYRRFPNDQEFLEELVIKDVYNFRNRNYLLRKLENLERKEIVDIESYTIEHIMPQNENLSQEWRKMLGENWLDVQEKYLHVLGNLTLTKYNSELSDKPFIKKRDMEGGFADSPLRLNRGLRQLETWNEEEIKKRGQLLGNRALLVWSYPEVSQELLLEHKKESRREGNVLTSPKDYPELTGEMLEVFKELQKRVLNLDSSVREEFKKKYIAYKTTTNFVDMVPQKSRLRLSLNMEFDEIYDPKGMCKDITDLGRWGNGDIEVGISETSKIEDVMHLIQQSFEKHRDGE